MTTSVPIVILLDALLVGLLVLALAPLAIYRKATFAVMKRNFVSYFTTPTGYVFLCLFVLLSSFAAFWPHQFFTSNMATLDQLSFAMPAILLLFIPAITMGIWAEERRQGTDELLLTIPADDFDIVLGKYLSAAAIFSCSLLFSQLANFSVLDYVAGGEVDLGLYFTTYLGYWFMGMAMLAVGMVASFLTSNLTLGFILGAVFNAPLALTQYADLIISDVNTAQAISRWSMAQQFTDFGRGVVSSSSVIYFLMIVAVGIYLSMVLIGRRHWLGGRDGQSLIGHYVVRIGALLIVAVAAAKLLADHDLVRYDATSERISSLSPDSVKLLRSLDKKRAVQIDAYISAT
ncbi:MAG: ABC-2 transporter permease, partial [Planctomycetales bacterium]|nr:ABC-2 transporter permease [Planctomycetales bacterium]